MPFAVATTAVPRRSQSKHTPKVIHPNYFRKLPVRAPLLEPRLITLLRCTSLCSHRDLAAFRAHFTEGEALVAHGLSVVMVRRLEAECQARSIGILSTEQSLCFLRKCDWIVFAAQPCCDTGRYDCRRTIDNARCTIFSCIRSKVGRLVSTSSTLSRRPRSRLLRLTTFRSMLVTTDHIVVRFPPFMVVSCMAMVSLLDERSLITIRCCFADMNDEGGGLMGGANFSKFYNDENIFYFCLPLTF